MLACRRILSSGATTIQRPTTIIAAISPSVVRASCPSSSSNRPNAPASPIIIVRGVSGSILHGRDHPNGINGHHSSHNSTSTNTTKTKSSSATTILSRLETLEARVHDLERLNKPSFRAGQYNILASYLGNNTEPWFLYGGLTSSPQDAERAKLIALKHRERDENGKYMNVGWPNYVQGILTQEEIERVERHHAEAFDWEVRAPKILDHIRNLDTDVLSLVELDQYDTFFRQELSSMGMDSVWVKRPRTSSHDGCAVAWKRTKFTLLAHEAVHFADDVEGERKDRVALLTLLQMKYAPNEPRLIFVSTHLARNPECTKQEAIRLRQAAQLMMKLKSFADANGCGTDVPAVVAGDWNAESLHEIRAVTSALFGLAGSLHGDVHPLLWGSMDVPTRRTSFTLLRQSRIDYLMYSETLLRLQAVQKIELDETETIPNIEHPSDHLPIAADFQYPTELEIAQECAMKFALCLLRGSALRRPLLPDELRYAFDYFDHDGSGAVSALELADGLRALGVIHSDEDLKTLQNALCRDMVSSDNNNNEGGELGEATFTTFRNAFANRFSNKRRDALLCPDGTDPFLTDVVRAFKYFDLDGNGSLSREEISTTLRAISPASIEESAIEDIIEMVDLDGDGDVQLEEFVAAMIKGHKSM